MNLQPKNIMFAFAFFTIITTFIVSLMTYGSYSSSNSFPNWQNYISASTIWQDGVNALGGSWGLFAPLQNVFVGMIFPFEFIYHFFTYIYLAISYIFGLIVYPYSVLPYPLNVLFATLLGVSILIMVIFMFQIGSSGFRNE